MTITVLFQTTSSSEQRTKVFTDYTAAETFVRTTNNLTTVRMLVDYSSFEFYKQQFELYQGIVHSHFISKSPLNMVIEETVDETTK